MAKEHNVFISWSGERSRWAADAIREWLPIVLQSAKPWMSEHDIDKGTRWLDEVDKALDGMKIGIICLTPENLRSAWILFEAGALAKAVDANSRVCTFLLGDLRPQDVERPLGMFQATTATKEDTKKLVYAINRALEGEGVSDAIVEKAFDALWTQLETKLAAMPPAKDPVRSKPRDVEDMVAEILDLARADAIRKKKTDSFDKYIPAFEELMPLLTEQLAALKAPRNALVHATAVPATIPSAFLGSHLPEAALISSIVTALESLPRNELEEKTNTLRATIDAWVRNSALPAEKETATSDAQKKR